MEKFRKFSDSQTGLNLFIPAYTNYKVSPLEFLNHLIIGTILVIIRIPLLIILILLALIFNLLQINLNKIFGKLILITCGFYNIDNQIPIEDKGGYLILSNHSSPIDWIYFMSQCSPNFITLVNNDTLQYRRLKFIEIIKNLFQINIAKSGDGNSLYEVINTNRPTVLFFEGCQTNQNGVLSPPTQLISDLQMYNQPINIYILTYQDHSYFTPINTTRNGYWHFILMLTNITNSLRIVSQEFNSSKDYEKLIIRFYECEGLRVVRQSFTIQNDFLEYYYRTQKGNYLKQE